MELVGSELFIDISKVFVQHIFYGAEFRTVDSKRQQQQQQHYFHEIALRKNPTK